MLQAWTYGNKACLSRVRHTHPATTDPPTAPWEAISVSAGTDLIAGFERRARPGRSERRHSSGRNCPVLVDGELNVITRAGTPWTRDLPLQRGLCLGREPGSSVDLQSPISPVLGLAIANPSNPTLLHSHNLILWHCVNHSITRSIS